MKSERIIEEIKSRIDIVEFISDYVLLKKAGQNYKGLCPFHIEKTPSFIVSPTKQMFHCFGCGIGGDIVSFIIKHDNLSFTEAIQYLAKRAGIDVSIYKRTPHDYNRVELFRINEYALNYFKNNLRNNENALNYVKKRGLNSESLKSFNIGLSSETSNGLYNHLKKNGFLDSTIKASGLVIQEGNHFRDFFRKRIIFPIYNLRNELIAFGGRVMDDSLPKYINTPETPIFKKSESLFGINLAKEHINKTRFAIIVEGYLDTIICHQYGFKNTVAPLGTALTLQHLKKLKFYTDKVILTFDSDQAGISAAKRSLKIVASSDFKARILLLQEGEDPDSFLRKYGSEEFKKKLSEALSIVDFIKDVSTGDKIEWVKEVLDIISLYEDTILANEIICELSDKSRYHETLLREEFEKIKKKNARYSRLYKEPIKQQTLKNKYPKEEYLLLSALLSFPENTSYILSSLNINDLYDLTIKKIFEKISNVSERLDVDNLTAQCDENERLLISEMLIKPGFDTENVDKIIDDCLRIIKKRRLEEKLKYAEVKGDIKLLDTLLKEKRKHMKGNKP